MLSFTTQPLIRSSPFKSQQSMFPHQRSWSHWVLWAVLSTMHHSNTTSRMTLSKNECILNKLKSIVTRVTGREIAATDCSWKNLKTWITRTLLRRQIRNLHTIRIYQARRDLHVRKCTTSTKSWRWTSTSVNCKCIHHICLLYWMQFDINAGIKLTDSNR